MRTRSERRHPGCLPATALALLLMVSVMYWMAASGPLIYKPPDLPMVATVGSEVVMLTLSVTTM